MEHMAVIRSMSTKEGDHGRATFLLRTGYAPQGPIHYPCLGSLVAKELRARGRRAARLREHRPLSTASARRRSAPASSGRSMRRWSSARRAPGVVTRPGEYDASALQVGDLERPAGVDAEQADARLGLLDDLTRELPGGASEFGVAEPSLGLRPGGAADAIPGRPRPSISTTSPRRCATPTAGARSGKAACSPAGWSSAGCRSSRSRCRGPTGPRRSPGTRTSRTSTRSRSSAACSTPAGPP